jgi:hypothetical protein
VADVNLGDSEVLTMFLVIVALGYNASRLHAAADLPAGAAQLEAA